MTDLTRYQVTCGQLHCDRCNETRGYDDGFATNEQTIAELIRACDEHEATHHTPQEPA